MISTQIPWCPEGELRDPKCEEPTSPKHIALAVFSVIVMLLGIIGNLVVILVIKYSQLRKEPGYILVTSLAAADLGVSLFVTTAKVHMYRRNGNFCSDLSFCVLHHITDGFFPTASITHLLLICINKFCAVTSPYKYHAFVTYTREVVVALCVWFYCLVWTAAGLVTWDADPLFSLTVLSIGIDRVCYNKNALFYVCAAICVFIIPVVVAALLYAILIVIVVEKTNSIPIVIGNGAHPEETTGLRKNPGGPTFGSKKGAKTLIMVFSGWVICWLPHFVLILVNYWSPLMLHSFAVKHRWCAEFITTVVSDVLPCINSCINPFIYFKTSYAFRHSLKDSYLKLMKKPRHRAGSSSVKRVGSWMSPSMETVVRYSVTNEATNFLTVRHRANDMERYQRLSFHSDF